MSYQPAFKGPIEGYATNYISRNLWKVHGTMEREDAAQEAYMVFAKCAERYPDMDTPQHFMALFKTALHRRFLDMAAENSRERATVVPIHARRDEDGEEMPAYDSFVGETENEGVMRTMLRQAPAEVLLVLQLFLGAPQELVELALGSSWNADGRRSTDGSARVNRLLGFPPGYDSVGAVRAYFGAAPGTMPYI